MGLIDQQLCGLAVDACDTGAFEQFVQAFHAALVGTSFVPLGGMHDGGADGLEDKIFESGGRATSFLQASKTGDIEGKIRQTIRRLKEFGRTPRVVTFYFSEPVSTIDKIEEDIGNAEDVTIRIRAKQYIEAHINDSPQTVQAFSSYLKPSVVHLLQIGATGQTHDYPFEARTLCAFLGQEVNRRRGNATVLVSVTDSLILWCLEGTDPERGILMSKAEMLEKIEGALPTARNFIRGIIDNRLEQLRSKNNPNGREISWHRKEDRYALRYEEREKLIQDNVVEAALFNSVSDALREQIRAGLSHKLQNRLSDITSVVLSCLDTLFQKQGVAMGLYFLGNEDTLGSLDIADDIDRKVDQLGLQREDRILVRDLVATAIRKLIYAPNETAREYLLKLSTTYFLLFALKNEPKVVEYFNSLAESLTLYVGSDLIVKALSEYHLPPESRMVSNTLKVLRESGAHLILGEPALEEVFSHLHASVLEFEHFYSECEPEIDEGFVHGIDRILIRAYFYAKLGINTAGKPPKGWRSYIGQFCKYEDLKGLRNRDGLRMYLCDRFGLAYETKQEMLTNVDRDELKRLTVEISLARRNRPGKGPRENILAYNDALHLLRIYSRRQQSGDNNAPNPFGYRTWWLTHEQAVQRASIRVLGTSKPRAIMRPEFLLNYIALMPTKREVVISFGTIFPTVLGVSLSKRAPEHMLHEVLTSAREAYSVDNSRAKVMLNEFSDRLKTDQMRIYDTKIS